MDIDTFSNTIAQVYDASLRVERWDDVLRSLATQFDSHYGQISYFTSLRDANPFFRLVGFDSAKAESLLPRYMELSPTDPRQPPRQFRAYHCRQLVSEERLRSSALYQQVLAPMRIEYAMYFFANLGEDENCAATVMRGPEGSPYTDEDCENFGRYVPHICRAVTVHGTLRRARAASAAMQALVDGVPMGMVIARDETIILANAAARALLAQGDPLRSLTGRLQATTPQTQARLDQAIQEAKSKPGSPIGVTLAADDGAQVRVIVRSLEPSTTGMLDTYPDALALYFADSRHPLETREEVLRRLFGLTEREAAVLRARVEGDDTQAIARRFGIGAETVKTHLQHVMQAVGVKRQDALIRLVLSSPAWITGPR